MLMTIHSTIPNATEIVYSIFIVNKDTQIIQNSNKDTQSGMIENVNISEL